MSGLTVARRLLPALARPFLAPRAPHDPAPRVHPEPATTSGDNAPADRPAHGSDDAPS